MTPNVWNEQCILSPSLICLDMCNLESQVAILEMNGIKALHIDILDGHFSPSMPLGLETVRQLRKKSKLFFDCHIMTDPPEFFVDELIDIGVDHICFHAETCSHIDGMINKIHDAGILAGVALKPSTSLNTLEYVIEKCDSVLLMLINPGYASSKGEKQVLYADRKINALKQLIISRNMQTKILIDGRISKENIEKFGRDTVDLFVCGSSCLDKNNLESSVKQLTMFREFILSNN
jgi:ribulose-phosphate 3-epimerase